MGGQDARQTASHKLMKITTMDEFLKYRVLPEHLPIVAMLRTMMRECAPKAKEQISYGILMWKQKRGLAVVSPTKKDITSRFRKARNLKTNTNCCRAWAKYPSTSRSRT